MATPGEMRPDAALRTVLRTRVLRAVLDAAGSLGTVVSSCCSGWAILCESPYVCAGSRMVQEPSWLCVG